MIGRTNALSGGGGIAGDPTSGMAIVVSYPIGSTCTCTNGTKTLKSSDNIGSCIFYPPSAGNWTVSCTDGTETASEVIAATAGNVHNVELSYFIPGAYQAVEYIEQSTSHGAYINTEIVASNCARVAAKVCTVRNKDVGTVLGVADGSGHCWRLVFNATTLNTRLNTSEYNVSGLALNTPLYLNVQMRIKSGTGYLKAASNPNGPISQTGHNVSTISMTKVANAYMSMFAGITTDGELQGSNYDYGGRIYWLRVYDIDDNLVAEFIPCYRKSDSKLGMYDRKRKKFYPSDGTDFTICGEDTNTADFIEIS